MIKAELEKCTVNQRKILCKQEIISAVYVVQ